MRRWFRASAAPGGEGRAVRLLGLAVVLALTGFQLARMLPSLALPWYQKADELVFAYEVIRFLRLDFRQHFFDIPGTPFMFLTAALWSAGHRLLWLAGLTGYASPANFAFAHLDALHVLMRGLTMGFYAVSVGLTYRLGRRLTNVAGGCVAALLLVTLPLYSQYSQFVRTESLGMCLMLAAVWWAYRGRETGRLKFYLWAGLAAGVATTARFHFAMAALPVLLAAHGFYRPAGESVPARGAEPPPTPRRYLALAGAFAAVFLVGALMVVGPKFDLFPPGRVSRVMMIARWGGDALAPHALATMRGVWLTLGTVCPVALAAYFVPRLRRYAAVVVNPPVITLLAAFAAGFLASGPTFLWEGDRQLGSIEQYANMTDATRANLGSAENWWFVTGYYFGVATPEPLVVAALALGAVLALRRRDRAGWPVVVGAAAAFVAHPPRMITYEHHILPWLPFLALLPAFAVAALVRAAGRLPGLGRAGSVPLLLAVLAVTLFVVRGRLAADRVDRSPEGVRCRVIAEMTAWVGENAPPDTDLYLAYWTFNEPLFLSWMEREGVRVPHWRVKARTQYHDWYYDRASLDGRCGLLAMTTVDVREWNAANAGRAADE
ncbi:MAG TPA: glycosyltransferase family 39 protein, partial [Gemmataceae bacterium]|nr:glycosyltransferase family 39 protein [Gemmataceae bacterium]